MQPIPFGKYLLVERLAQGGMAEVFRAVYQGGHGFEKQVAVKRILPVFDGAREFVAMFVDEARIASSLTHVNVVQVSDFGELDGTYYLAMELVDGVDLGRLREAAARRGVALPVPIIAYIVAEAARGLAYAHEKRGPDGTPLGIVHRDVSPQNVLVSYAGEVKIADFGIAKAAGKLHKTESGAVMGKIRYMSPEQINGEPLDGRSDLFALGVIFWELLAGTPLWTGDNPGALSDQVKHAKIEPPSRRGRPLPAELDRIACKTLERGRDARYGRAGELARELSAWLAHDAPTLTREDVGAFVAEVIPRELETTATERATAAPTPTATPTPTPTPTVDRRGPTAAAPPADLDAYARTRLAKTPPARPRSRAPLWAAGGIVLVVGGGLALRSWWPADHAAAPPLAVPDDGGAAVASRAADAGGVSDADRLRLTAELEALPRAASAWRGVAAEDYLALLSAVDGALCLTPQGAREPVLPAAARARVEHEELLPEAMALGRYLLATGALPPRVSVALQAFLRSHPPFAPGAAGWAFAHLGALVLPDDATLRLAVLRQNGALGGWRDGARDGALPYPALCERQAAVEAYRTRAHDERAAAFERYLRATPPELPVDVGGLRYSVIGAERDEAAATLLLHVRVTNPGADDQPLPLGAARLGGLDAAPAIDPPAARLGGGLVRELRLRFSGVTDAVAEAAVLVLRPGVELQAYSEDLR
jgi:hypothetical protein